MSENKIVIYGTWWCGDCLRTRRYFERNQINYIWIDIDKDKQGEEFVISTNNGMRSVPTILFVDGSTLTEPGEIELQSKLSHLIPNSKLP
jgi:mycoredoxin